MKNWQHVESKICRGSTKIGQSCIFLPLQRMFVIHFEDNLFFCKKSEDWGRTDFASLCELHSNDIIFLRKRIRSRRLLETTGWQSIASKSQDVGERKSHPPTTYVAKNTYDYIYSTATLTNPNSCRLYPFPVFLPPGFYSWRSFVTSILIKVYRFYQLTI